MSIVQLSFWDEDIPVQPELPQAAGDGTERNPEQMCQKR